MLRIVLTIGLVLGLTASDAWCAALCGAERPVAAASATLPCHGDDHSPTSTSAVDPASPDLLTLSHAEPSPPPAPCSDDCAGCEAERPLGELATPSVEVPAPECPGAHGPTPTRQLADAGRLPVKQAPSPPAPRTARDLLARKSTLLL